MRRLATLILALLLVAACVPTLEVDDKITPVMADKYLNENPDLALGETNLVFFVNSAGDDEYIHQNIPEGYTLYQDITGNPIDINYTGIVYSFLPHGTSGDIGFTLSPMTLTPGQYIIYVVAEAHLWGNPLDYAIVAMYTIDGVPGEVEFGAHPLGANGDHLAAFTLNAPELGDYNVSIFFRFVFPPTADSYATIRSVTVEDAR